MPDLTNQFDIHDKSMTLDRLHRELVAFRSECPVGRTETYGGMWVISHYKEIDQILSDPELFSSRSVRIPEIPIPPTIPIELDPPRHGQYRSLLQAWFSPPSIAKFEHDVRHVARRLIAGLGDECDLGPQYARPLPLQVIATALGVPADDLEQVVTWGNTLVEKAGIDLAEVAMAFSAFVGYMFGLVAKRRDEPSDDLISYLLTTEVDGSPLPDEVVAEYAYFIALAGFETTAKAINTALDHLIRHPEVAAELRRGDLDMTAATEELLRLCAGVTTVRVATSDCTVGGQQIAAGERLHLLLPSGSQDESVFENADSLDFGRNNNRHLAFGLGIHRCLGMHLARLEFRVAIEELLAATETIELLEDRPSQFDMAQTWGVISTPVRIRRRTA